MHCPTRDSRRVRGRHDSTRDSRLARQTYDPQANPTPVAQSRQVVTGCPVCCVCIRTYVYVRMCLRNSSIISILGPPTPPPSQAMPGPKQIVAQKRTHTTYFADGTTHVSGGQKKNGCKKFSGNPREICFAEGSRWTNGMCMKHAREAGCQPPPKKAKTLRICNVCEQ